MSVDQFRIFHTAPPSSQDPLLPIWKPHKHLDITDYFPGWWKAHGTPLHIGVDLTDNVQAFNQLVEISNNHRELHFKVYIGVVKDDEEQPCGCLAGDKAIAASFHWVPGVVGSEHYFHPFICNFHLDPDEVQVSLCGCSLDMLCDYHDRARKRC